MSKRNFSGLFFMMIGILAVLGVGFFVFQTFIGEISGPTTSSQMNASMNAGNTVFNIGGMFLIIVAIMAIVGLIYYRVSTPQRYKKFSKIIDFLNTTTYYFGWGLLSFVSVAVPGYLLWLLFQYTVSEGRTGMLVDVLKWVPVAIFAYFALAGFGYVMKKKIVDNWRQRRKEREEELVAKGLDKTMW